MFLTIRVHSLSGDNKEINKTLGNVTISTSGDDEIYIEWKEKTTAMSLDEAKKIAKIVLNI